MELQLSVVLTFLLVIIASLIFDLGVFSRQEAGKFSLTQSIFRSLGWFLFGLLSVAAIYLFYPEFLNFKSIDQIQNYLKQHGSGDVQFSTFDDAIARFKTETTTAYLTGFLLEYALSIDNLFVMLLIFQSFKVNSKDETRILIWGVIGAMVLRLIFVVLGTQAIEHFHWILYVFGLFLVYTGAKLLFNSEDDQMNPKEHPIFRWGTKWLRISNQENHAHKFIVRWNSKWFVTPLFLILLIVEFTDLVFALDSVPAVFGVTSDPNLVFLSNIFAILGLRSLYFLLGHGMDKFYALKYGLSFILVFIGVKMVFEPYFIQWGFSHVHNLLVIGTLLIASIVFSLLFPERK